MDDSAAQITLAREAVVVFEDRTDARLLAWLRPGFRHCFCLVGEGRRWTLCDPLKSRLAVATLEGPSATSLARRLTLASPGRRILAGLVISSEDVRPGAGLRPLTCVEVVKRLVGLHAPSVLTPSQLYRRLLLPEPRGGAFVEVTHGIEPEGKA